ncbi:hypothetical protein NFI96_034113, partial [Prochilodus magdalenae]
LAVKMANIAMPLSNKGNGDTIGTQVIPSSITTQPGQMISTGGPFQRFLKGEPKALGVRGALLMNVVSTISAGIAIILLSVDLSTERLVRFCNDGYYSNDVCRHPGLRTGIVGVLLVFSIMQFVISICISAFACKATCSKEPAVDIVVVPDGVEGQPVVSPSPVHNNQQYPLCANNDTTRTSPPMENLRCTLRQKANQITET